MKIGTLSGYRKWDKLWQRLWLRCMVIAFENMYTQIGNDDNKDDGDGNVDDGDNNDEKIDE